MNNQWQAEWFALTYDLEIDEVRSFFRGLDIQVEDDLD